MTTPNTWNIHFSHGKTIVCAEDQTILQAAIAENMLLPYNCQNGACGSCQGRILSGQVDLGKARLETLTEAQRTEGWALLCCAYPRSDITVDIRVIPCTQDYPVTKIPTRVLSVEKIQDNIAILTLQLPGHSEFRFQAGQYIDILLRDGKRRSFSIANAPSAHSKTLELHVKYAAGGVFTEQVFNTLKTGDLLRIEGPLGTFFWNSDDHPVALLATGTGFAPIKAMIEDLIQRQASTPITLYWGGQTETDLYASKLVEQWQQQYPLLKFIPVIATPSADWTGRQGYIQDALCADQPDLSQWHVYACGSPAMVQAAQIHLTTQAKLPLQAFFADAFTLAAPSDVR